MRVITGKYKGLKLDGYDIVGTRPTQDRVKESLFAMIQNKVKNSKCLDLFAGSGSLGIEAISMGASSATFVDINFKAISVLKNNTKRIEEELLFFNSDYKNFLKTTNEQFDIIFLDPPYHLLLINDCIDLIKKNNLLKRDGIIVCEYEEEVINYDSFKEKKYGKTYIKIIKDI
ncbi:MAG: 16S rRNA (guanine(966)-N(2))-methyltransferase RsmD [Mycoplasmatota bacterium]